jgi:N-carbamoyl-L-amino-acid hydrolase
MVPPSLPVDPSAGLRRPAAAEPSPSTVGHVKGEDLRIDATRLRVRLHELAEIGAIDGGGNCRLALTDADRAGRDLVVGWMRDLGLVVSVDGIGNVIGVRSGLVEGPPVMCGSHVDTVRTGGRFDGNYGVLSGLEVIETLAERDIVTHHPLAVAFFTNEEGARFAPDMMGSLVFAGGMPLEVALDTVGIDGVRVGDELERIGYVGSVPCPGAAPRAFVELHIEQGPVLEREGVTIGVVESVQGISWQELTVRGQSNHAGTTPMRFRHDAAYVAAAITTYVRELTRIVGGAQVGTVGSVELAPSLVNVVASTAKLTVDLRNTDERALQRAEHLLAEHVAKVAADEGVHVERRSLARFEPVVFDPRVVDLVETTAKSLGASTMRMPSGAGHDAQMLARVCPTGMIFVPSAGGLSHNPAEHTDDADLATGADVLLHTLLALAAPEGVVDR